MINKLKRIRSKRKLIDIMAGLIIIPRSTESITMIAGSQSNPYSSNNPLGEKITHYKEDNLNQSGEYR